MKYHMLCECHMQSRLVPYLNSILILYVISSIQYSNRMP
jgi:hypothetical protein